MKIIANYRDFSRETDNREHWYTVSGQLSIRLNAFLGQYDCTRTERGEERPTDVESRRIAYACKYKEELGGTGERRRSH